jgi:hypothetical protein
VIPPTAAPATDTDNVRRAGGLRRLLRGAGRLLKPRRFCRAPPEYSFVFFFCLGGGGGRGGRRERGDGDGGGRWRGAVVEASKRPNDGWFPPVKGGDGTRLPPGRGFDYGHTKKAFQISKKKKPSRSDSYVMICQIKGAVANGVPTRLPCCCCPLSLASPCRLAAAFCTSPLPPLYFSFLFLSYFPFVELNLFMVP